MKGVLYIKNVGDSIRTEEILKEKNIMFLRTGLTKYIIEAEDEKFNSLRDYEFLAPIRCY